jgi:hypothetical protein
MSGVPLLEGKMPPRGKETIHRSNGGTDFILAPVKVKGGEWKAVKKSSSMDTDWLVKTRSMGKPVAIVSYDEGTKKWIVQHLQGSKVKASISGEAATLAKALDYA